MGELVPKTAMEAVRSDEEWVLVLRGDAQGRYHRYDASEPGARELACWAAVRTDGEDNYRFMRKEDAEEWREPCTLDACWGEER